MKFLGTLWALLMQLFPYEMDKVQERTISEIFVLDAAASTYTGDFKASIDTANPDVATTNKLVAGDHFSVGGHAVEIAKVPIVGGVNMYAQAKWMNYVDPAVFTATGEADQLRQIYSPAASLQFYYGDGDKLIGMGTQTSRYESPEPAMAGVANYHRFTPSFKFYNMNGDNNNKVVLTLPTGSVTTALGGDGSTYVIALRISKKGFDTTAICGSRDALYSIPQGCDESCGCCAGDDAANNVHTPKMVRNEDNDHGILV